MIVTDTCGAAELVHHGRNGWIVPSANVNALAAAITAALNSRKDLPEMGRLAVASTSKKVPVANACKDLRRWFYPVAQNSLQTKLAKFEREA